MKGLNMVDIFGITLLFWIFYAGISDRLHEMDDKLDHITVAVNEVICAAQEGE